VLAPNDSESVVRRAEDVDGHGVEPRGSIRRPDESAVELDNPWTSVAVHLDSEPVTVPLMRTLKPWFCKPLMVSAAEPSGNGFPSPKLAPLAINQGLLSVVIKVHKTARMASNSASIMMAKPHYHDVSGGLADARGRLQQAGADAAGDYK
jgi:hypothetical protein